LNSKEIRITGAEEGLEGVQASVGNFQVDVVLPGVKQLFFKVEALFFSTFALGQRIYPIPTPPLEGEGVYMLFAAD